MQCIELFVSQASLVAHIAELVENRMLEGISDVRDESDRDGIRVVVDVKRGALPQVVLNNLYKHTKLQTTFSCNMVNSHSSRRLSAVIIWATVHTFGLLELVCGLRRLP